MEIKRDYKVRTIAGQNIVISYGELNVSMTKVISLNDTSLYLWNKLFGKSFELEDVVSALLDEYEVEPSQASKDAANWISLLQKAGLLYE
ncbi:MAG: PqqD family protein [Rikenellaceae bacterium]